MNDPKTRRNRSKLALLAAWNHASYA
jgi:hypothetical protein